MTTQWVNALPRKRFFLDMFTRDISLEACILDLIDNSIDGLVRSKGIDFSKIILQLNGDSYKRRKKIPLITVTYSDNNFVIEDYCGGISTKEAREDVFNFGHDASHSSGKGTRQLGAYGIGLKRALFKIGEEFEFTSRTDTEGFSVTENVSKWSEKDEDLEDWRFKIEEIGGVANSSSAGTRIVIRKLRQETRLLFKDKNFETRLSKVIGQTYALFLNRFVLLKLNGENLEPMPIPFGQSDRWEKGRDSFVYEGVKVELVAGLAAKGEWRTESAGWYVLCNGRVVVSGDKTDLTGWGGGVIPAYHSKYRGFLGLAIFLSKEPLKLPWTTTKRSLNRESEIFLVARNRMASLTRPVITSLDRFYPEDDIPEERNIADHTKQIDIRKAVGKKLSKFEIPVASKKPSSTMRITYDAQKTDVEKIRRHLKKPAFSGREIGLHTLKYFLKHEGLS